MLRASLEAPLAPPEDPWRRGRPTSRRGGSTTLPNVCVECSVVDEHPSFSGAESVAGIDVWVPRRMRRSLWRPRSALESNVAHA